MDKWIPAGAAVLAALLIAWQGYSISVLSTRLDQLETRSASTAQVASGDATPGRSARGAGRSRGRNIPMEASSADDQARSARPERSMRERIDSLPASDDPKALNLQDPEVREQVASLLEEVEEQRRAEQDQERSQRFKESMQQELADFSEEVGLADTVRTQVQAELDRRTEAWTAVKEDVRSGNMSWIDARREMEAVREDSDATLTELLGEEDFQSLDERLWGTKDRRGPR